MPQGVYQRTKRNPDTRFAQKYVIEASGCWVWIGSKTPEGYGQFWTGDGHTGAHRWSYERHVGAIPERYVIDHLCRNPSCVNPAHLDCVTMKTNTERGVLYETLAAKAKAKTHCKRGHPLFGANLRIDTRGDRGCRSCQCIKGREWKAANRARVNERQQARRTTAPRQKREPIGRICPHCNTEFEAKRIDTHYCSLRCYKSAWQKGRAPRKRKYWNQQTNRRDS